MTSLPSVAETPSATLIRHVRVVPVGTDPRGASVTDAPVDLRISDGMVQQIAPEIPPQSSDLVVDADGRWAIPGLWDAHVHLAQWAQNRRRLDLSSTSSAAEVLRRVTEHLAGLSPAQRSTVLVGAGYRSATWPVQPTVEMLDGVSGEQPVILISGDGHNGWLNSAALRLVGSGPRSKVLDENDWFPIFARVAQLTGAEENDEAYAGAVRSAASLGVVGIVDLEFGPSYRDWPERFARGIDQLRVRAATYPETLDEVIAAGLRSGQPLGDSGLLTMGPLKIISDGSLNTRTASCCQPYADAAGMEFPHGKQNYPAATLVDLLGRADASGLRIALHAIGDAAVSTALDAFATTGAPGSLEHAQLMCGSDIERMARLGITASVQPAHLLDDRDVTAQCWPDRADRCFPFASMVRAGVTLALGSDAPVSPLDPWLAMAAAVHRSADEREPWNPAESLTAAQALVASTDGQGTLTPGSRGDVVLLDADPLLAFESSAAAGAHLRQLRVAATFLAGRPTHLAL